MNDNKDITEFEYEIEAIINRATSISGELDIKEVINCLREIMPPVCTLNERKFLDEIKRNGKIDSDGYLVFSSYEPYNDSPGTQLDQSDFEANLSELVEGKQ
jgi:hypothetical protein